MGKLFARVTFVPSLIYNLVMERAGMLRWFDRIDDRIILGALPFKSMTKQLVEEEGVGGVVSMNEDYELKYLSNMTEEWSQAGVRFLQLSTTDIFEAPNQEKLQSGVKFIEDFDKNNEKNAVYVHCKAGRTRSSTLVACYLMKKNGWTPEKAVAAIREKRAHIFLGPMQHQAIKEFYSSINKSSRS